MHRIGKFAVDSRRQQLLVGLTAPILVHAAAIAFSVAGRLGRRRLLQRMEWWWSAVVVKILGLRSEILGAELLPAGPAILLPLHEGFVDAPLLMRLGRSMRFIVRDELFEWPQLGKVLRNCGHPILPANPTIADFRALRRDAGEVLEQGHDLVIFPQGSILGVEVAFARGARRIAAQFNVPIVPIVITGTHRAWEHPYAPTLRRGCRVRLEVLPPISADELAWRDVERQMKQIALSQIDAPARRFVPSRDGYWDGYDYEIDPEFAELRSEIEKHRKQTGERLRR